MAGYAGYDIATLLVVIVFALLGLAGGFLRQVIRLVAVLLAGWAAMVWGPDLLKVAGLAQTHGTSLVAPLIVFLVLYLVIIVIGALVLKLLRATSPGISLMDRLLGLLVGAVKGGVLVYIVTAIVIFAAGSARVAGLGTENSVVYAWVKQHPVRMGQVKKVEKKVRINVEHVLKAAKQRVKKYNTNPDKDAVQNTDGTDSTRKNNQ